MNNCPITIYWLNLLATYGQWIPVFIHAETNCQLHPELCILLDTAQLETGVIKNNIKMNTKIFI